MVVQLRRQYLAQTLGVLAMKLRYRPTETSTAYLDNFTVHHEYDSGGNHRLQIEGKVGDWQNYAGICKLQHNNVWFAGTTEYWLTELPEVFIINPLKKHDLNEDDPPIPKRLTLKEQLALRKGV